MGDCALEPLAASELGNPTGKGRPNHPFPKAVCLWPSPPLPLTHVSWVPKKKTWYLLAADFTAVSGISSICEQEEK